MYECHVPRILISKRLKVGINRILRIRKCHYMDSDTAFVKYKPRSKFTKFHSRIKERINELILHADHPLQSSDILKVIKEEFHSSICRKSQIKYLKERLNITYR